MPLAIVFSFPRAALIWALLLLAVQAFYILFRAVPLAAGITICILVVFCALCTGWVLYPSCDVIRYIPRFELPRRFLSWWRRGKKIQDVERQD